MHSFIVARLRRFPIELGIVVGHPATIGTVPLGGKMGEAEVVDTSRDATAADTVGARLLGVNSQAIRYLCEAGQIGPAKRTRNRSSFRRCRSSRRSRPTRGGHTEKH